MQRDQDGHDDQDAAWQSIIDNYGDPVLGDDDVLDAEPADSENNTEGDTESNTGERASVAEPARRRPEPDPDEERFVPPVPPPIPRPPPGRLLAWIGMLGSPAVALISILADIGLPALLGSGLVVAFLAGFGYLIMTMDNEPRDPWDDGAQV